MRDFRITRKSIHTHIHTYIHTPTHPYMHIHTHINARSKPHSGKGKSRECVGVKTEREEGV